MLVIPIVHLHPRLLLCTHTSYHLLSTCRMNNQIKNFFSNHSYFFSCYLPHLCTENLQICLKSKSLETSLDGSLSFSIPHSHFQPWNNFQICPPCYTLATTALFQARNIPHLNYWKSLLMNHSICMLCSVIEHSSLVQGPWSQTTWVQILAPTYIRYLT